MIAYDKVLMLHRRDGRVVKQNWHDFPPFFRLPERREDSTWQRATAWVSVLFERRELSNHYDEVSQ